ncbi:MAG TPA: hypothetical protein VFY13_02755 [Luteolibacter sp.]|nr:hypothetical protein [Luteolibacter sp.]
MNRRKDEPKASLCMIIAVILGAAIIASGGVLHAYYKNRQVQITREIDAVGRSIEECRLEIRTSEMRMDQLLNRYLIRKKLEEHSSTLRPIPVAAIEEIQPQPPARRSVASADP